MIQIDHVEVAHEAAALMRQDAARPGRVQTHASKFLSRVGRDFAAASFATDLRENPEYFAELLGISSHHVTWMAQQIERGIRRS